MFDDLVYGLVQLTDNKLIAAVVPVLLGAGLLAWWFKLRDRRLAIRDESLKFVNETADLLNKALSPLFGAIRYRSTTHLDVVDQGVSDLFEHRLGTRARSLALLESPDFWREYDAITWQLRECVDTLRAALLDSRPAESSTIDDNAGVESEWDQSLRTAKDIWSAAAKLVEAGIDCALRGKRPKFPPREPGSREVMQLRND